MADDWDEIPRLAVNSLRVRDNYSGPGGYATSGNTVPLVQISRTDAENTSSTGWTPLFDSPINALQYHVGELESLSNISALHLQLLVSGNLIGSGDTGSVRLDGYPNSEISIDGAEDTPTKASPIVDAALSGTGTVTLEAKSTGPTFTVYSPTLLIYGTVE